MKMQKKILKNSQGITLVALIVTIIVLLILAGVSINLVVGENGILNKAQNAVK
jgi:type II secretory pathway pseudopilin PulG